MITEQDGTAANIILFLIALIPIYFLPTIIAKKGHRFSIFIANLVFGWTGAGWIMCLIMSRW